MTVLSSIARFILITDAKLQSVIGDFFVARGVHLRDSATKDAQAADATLTAELATIERQHREQVAALTKRLADQRLEAQEKAQARRDILVNDAMDEFALAESIKVFGSKRRAHAANLHMAIGYMEGP